MVSELSSENVFSDNLESKDIETLEELLSSKDDVIGVNCLYQWILDVIADTEKGILFLSAERGLGKSTFCATINQLECTGVQMLDEDLLEQWYELESDTAIRVWHFSSDYRGRKDIFVPGIRDAMLSLESGTTIGRGSRGNILKGKLEAQWNSLLTCDKNLRKLVLAECLNALLKLADKYTPERLEHACKAALKRIPSPRYKNIRLILESGNDKAAGPSNQSSEAIHDESYALVRGASYYGGGSHEK